MRITQIGAGIALLLLSSAALTTEAMKTESRVLAAKGHGEVKHHDGEDCGCEDHKDDHHDDCGCEDHKDDHHDDCGDDHHDDCGDDHHDDHPKKSSIKKSANAEQEKCAENSKKAAESKDKRSDDKSVDAKRFKADENSAKKADASKSSSSKDQAALKAQKSHEAKATDEHLKSGKSESHNRGFDEGSSTEYVDAGKKCKETKQNESVKAKKDKECKDAEHVKADEHSKAAVDKASLRGKQDSKSDKSRAAEESKNRKQESAKAASKLVIRKER